MKRILLYLSLSSLFFACKEKQEEKEVIEEAPKEQHVVKSYKTIGEIERIKDEINNIIPKDAVIEVLANTMVWSEGPLWIPEKKWLLCSDVMENRIHKWSEKDGFEIYLEPAGFTGDSTDSRERGSNGLILDKNGVLTLCQHGDRRVAQMNSSLDDPKPAFSSFASTFEGKRFNSPNDLIFDSKGNLYFTDPPFGLSETLEDDPKKELPYQGVFKMDEQGVVSLLTDVVSRPNGIAFSPDERTLYVSETDGDKAAWFAFPVLEDGTLGDAEEILNVSDLIGKEVGYPDGIKVDANGNIFTAGPGGLWIFNKNHELIGKIKPGQWVSNCAFDEDYKTLYITADDYLLRIRL